MVEPNIKIAMGGGVTMGNDFFYWSGITFWATCAVITALKISGWAIMQIIIMTGHYQTFLEISVEYFRKKRKKEVKP